MVRDTDKDWEALARAAPYFAVLTSDRYLKPDAAALSDFFATGEAEIAHFEAVLRRVFGQFTPTSALDFGCGVGRLLIPLARRAGTAFGVDIAEPMLELAGKHAAEARVAVELGKTIPTDRKFDWVNTIIVLQHIPPARGYGLIRLLWDCVAPGGALTMHVTIYKDEGLAGELPPDAAGGISMYDYDLSRVFEAMHLNEGCPIHMEKRTHGGVHGVRIYVRKEGA